MTAYDDAVLADSPWGYWPGLPSGSGGFTDASPNGRNLTGVSWTPLSSVTMPDGLSAPVWVSGPSAVGPNVSISSAVGCSWECWVKFTTTAQAALMAEANNVASSPQSEMMLWLTSAGHPTISMWGEGGVGPRGAAIADGQWHHVVGVADFPATTLRLYVDGVQVATATPPSIYNMARLFRLHAGADGAAVGGPNYTGALGKPAFYQSVLSADRVLAHYNAMSTAPADIEVIAGVAEATSAVAGPTVSVTQNVDLTAVAAQGVAVVETSEILATRNVDLLPQVATASAAVAAPTVIAGQGVEVLAGPAAAQADATATQLGLGCSVTSRSAMGSAEISPVAVRGDASMAATIVAASAAANSVQFSSSTSVETTTATAGAACHSVAVRTDSLVLVERATGTAAIVALKNAGGGRDITVEVSAPTTSWLAGAPLTGEWEVNVPETGEWSAGAPSRAWNASEPMH